MLMTKQTKKASRPNAVTALILFILLLMIVFNIIVTSKLNNTTFRWPITSQNMT